MKKQLFIISLISLAASYGAAREIVVNPGQLPEEILLVKESPEKRLTIKGTATALDLTSLRLLPSEVTELDLSQLIVKGCAARDGGWFGHESFEDGELPPYMLMGTNVSTLVPPAYISSVGTGAFSGTPLTELTLTGVKNIGEGAFYGCEKLKTVTLSGQNLVEVPENLFAGCKSLETVKLPNVITKIGKKAFEHTAVKSIFLPNVKEIGDYAFAFAEGLTEIYFANGCRMGEGVFYSTGSLENVPAVPSNYPSLYTASGEYPDTLSIRTEEIGEGAFAKSGISVIGINPEVRKIGRHSFSSMPNLKSVDVSGCDVITDVDPTAFAGNNLSAVTLYVAKGEIEKWKQAPVWCDFNISDDESGIGEIFTAVSDIEIGYKDGYISAISSSPIREFTLYNLGGTMLYSVDPEAEEVTAPFPEGEEVVIVRVAGETGVRIKKVMK